MPKSPSTMQRNFPTFRLIFAPVRWLFRNRRRFFALALILVAMVAVPTLWWATQLVGLPDVGDPFDLVAFRAETIPDDRNAFVLYRQAVQAYRPPDRSDKTITIRFNRQARWPTAEPWVRQWVEANRPALDLIRQGSERPDAFDPGAGKYGGSADFEALALLQQAILIEASRLEDQGDMAGAWAWYRVDLRLIHHVSLRAETYRRHIASNWHDELNMRLLGWAADSRTTPELIRAAIADAMAAGALVASDAYTLKAEYQRLMAGRETWDFVGGAAPPAWLRYFKAPRFLTPEQIEDIMAADRTWHAEPERSKRLARLLLANRLAYLDLPPARRPAPEADLLPVKLYKFGSEAPPAARALTPAKLDRWLDSSTHAADLTLWWNKPWLAGREQAAQQTLLVLLGSELYRRAHAGANPPTDEALVGPYLPSLPAPEPD